jgi:hypothetical protein
VIEIYTYGENDPTRSWAWYTVPGKTQPNPTVESPLLEGQLPNLAEAQAWIIFVERLRDMNHELPGNYADLAQMIKSGLEIVDPVKPICDAEGIGNHHYLDGTFEIILDGLASMGIKPQE